MKRNPEIPSPTSITYYKGSFSVLASASLLGSVAILALFAYKENVNVMTMLLLRFSLSTLFLFLFSICKKGYQCVCVERKQFLRLFLLGGVFYAFFCFSYFSSIQYIPASLAVLIFYTYPTLVAIVSSFINKERITRIVVMSIFLSFFGLYFVSGPGLASANIKGLLLAVCASVFYAAYVIYGHSVMKVTPFHITVDYVYLCATIFYGIGGLLAQNVVLPRTFSAWFYVFLVSFISVCGFITFFIGVKLTTPTVASILSMVEPLVTVLLSVIFFQDRLSLMQGIGGGLVLLGALLIILKNRIEKR
jgi:drug/metabolite transporter (DMT)-like permease